MSDTDPTDRTPDGQQRERPRRGPQIAALVVIVLVIIALVIALTPRGGGDGDPRPTTTTTAEETTTTTDATTTTEATTTTTEPPRPGRFQSARGWSIQPGVGWMASTEDADADLVIWVLPSGAAVTVQTIANEEGFAVTADSVASGMPAYLKDAFEASGPTETEEVEMDGRWAVRGRADTVEGRVVATVGSPGRVTFIVAIHGEDDAVDRGMDDYEEAVSSFRYE